MTSIDFNIYGVLVNSSRMTDYQFMDVIRLSLRLNPLSHGDDCRGRVHGYKKPNKTKEPISTSGIFYKPIEDPEFEHVVVEKEVCINNVMQIHKVKVYRKKD